MNEWLQFVLVIGSAFFIGTMLYKLLIERSERKRYEASVQEKMSAQDELIAALRQTKDKGNA